jgi:hypothetical protein
MAQGITGADAAARLAQVLQFQQQQEMDLANRLLRVQTQESVQDSALGARIDTHA